MHTRYSPVRRSPAELSKLSSPLPLDLHVLGLSLAFILSQDQTLRCWICLFFFFFCLLDSHPIPADLLRCFLGWNVTGDLLSCTSSLSFAILSMCFALFCRHDRCQWRCFLKASAKLCLLFFPSKFVQNFFIDLKWRPHLNFMFYNMLSTVFILNI